MLQSCLNISDVNNKAPMGLLKGLLGPHSQVKAGLWPWACSIPGKLIWSMEQVGSTGLALSEDLVPFTMNPREAGVYAPKVSLHSAVRLVIHPLDISSLPVFFLHH